MVASENTDKEPENRARLSLPSSMGPLFRTYQAEDPLGAFHSLGVESVNADAAIL